MTQFGTSRLLRLSLFLSFLSGSAWAQEQSTSQSLGRFLVTPEVAGTLLVLGILFGFLSIIVPGTGVTEVLCFGSFVLLFGGRYLEGGGIWIPLALLIGGGLFAAMEFFLFPGTAVFGILSLISFGGLSVLLMESPRTGLFIFATSVALCVVSLGLVLKFAPKNALTRRFLVLEPPSSEGDSASMVGLVEPLVRAGDVGEVVNTLRPVGSALFGTERIEVVSEGEFLQKGTKVEVVKVEGSRIVVRSCL